MNRLWIPVFTAVFMYSLMAAGCGDDVNIPPASTRLVILYSPADDVSLQDSIITFKWGTTSESADSFKFQLARDSVFRVGVQTYGTTNREYSVNPFAADSAYTYWRVTAFWRSHNDSGLSSVRKFRQY